jgi:hypothetical protein
MVAGARTGSERQGAGHADREDGTGRCGRKPVCRTEAEKRGDTPKGRGRGRAVVHTKRSECWLKTLWRYFCSAAGISFYAHTK